MVGSYTRVFTVILKTRLCGVERLGVAALVKRLRIANWSCELHVAQLMLRIGTLKISCIEMRLYVNQQN